MADAKTDPQRDPNIPIYNAAPIVQHYAALNYLTPCERLLFETYLKPGMAILDLGVGGGRTTPYLSSITARYVGVDYAGEMIAACRRKFPQLDFEVGDAADLSIFASSRFDAVVMAFNGMDYMIPDGSRLRALREISRVLAPSGILIFSSHNPRSILARASWNPQRVRDLAGKIVRPNSVPFRPVLRILTILRAVAAAVNAFTQSLIRLARRLPTRAFWRGDGYWTDPAHGGLKTHGATPEKVSRELSALGFQLLRVLGDDYPQVSHLYITDWYYYVFSNTDASGEK